MHRDLVPLQHRGENSLPLFEIEYVTKFVKLIALLRIKWGFQDCKNLKFNEYFHLRS